MSISGSHWTVIIKEKSVVVVDAVVDAVVLIYDVADMYFFVVVIVVVVVVFVVVHFKSLLSATSVRKNVSGRRFAFQSF